MNYDHSLGIEAKPLHAVLLVRNDFLRNDGWFDPRVMNCARALLQDGWLVTVVCDQKSPEPLEDNSEGMAIIRTLWHRAAGSKGDRPAWVRLLRQTPLLSMLNHQFCLCSMPNVFRYLDKRPVDLVVANDVEMLPLGATLARRKGSRLIYDSHEYHASRAVNVMFHGLMGRLRTFVYKTAESIFIKKADMVTTVGKSLAKRLERDHGLKQVEVIRNYPTPQKTESNEFIRQSYNLPEDRIIIIYVGGLQVGRGCRTLVRLAPRLPQATVFFLGDGPQRAELEHMAAGLPTGKVIFHGKVPQKDVGLITASADIGACLISPNSLSHQLASPNKIFIYMMAGLPVVASNFAEMTGLLEKPGLGLCVDPLNDDAITSAFNRLMLDKAQRTAIGRRGKQAYEQRHNWDHEKELLLGLYRKLAANKA